MQRKPLKMLPKAVVVTVAALATLALAAPSASAAVIPLPPTYPSAADAPGGTFAGFNAPVSIGVLPPGSTVTPLELPEPAPSTGFVLDPATRGTVTMTSERIITESNSNSSVADSPVGTSFPSSTPENVTVLSDFWLRNSTNGAWKYEFDFSGLAGGVLPAGSLLNTSDIDVCSATRPEGIQMTADSALPWLQFDFHRQITGLPATGTPAVVTLDDASATYSVTAATPCGDVNMGDWFTTTRPITTLTVVMNNVAQASGFVYFGMRVPVLEAAPAVEVVKTTNGENILQAPGPEISIGEDVRWEYEVRNTGNVALADVTVVDDKVDSGNIDCGAGTNVVTFLEVGESVICVATGLAEEGSYTNTATVTGLPVTSTGEAFPGLETVTAQDTSWYTGVVAGEEVIPPTSSPTSVPAATLTSDKLASTGAEVTIPLVSAATAFLLGAFLLWRRRAHRINN
ncbi:hypothetical protein QCD70_04150 [Agreia sp. PsM10]|uniref:DUF7507 domain-containing protein n=1 Tax=Agreia sp. PsM10 TaxID=3030533 RepID=UPI00263A89B3|nr:hypothetical protein [Agreia sp. PsM10]MDN4639429.1 hypothetical protein [Agreia sp. PsM10]